MDVVVKQKVGKNTVTVLSKRFFVKKVLADGKEITIPVRRTALKISDNNPKHDIVFGVVKRKLIDKDTKEVKGIIKTFSDSRFNVKRTVEVNLWGRTEVRGFEGARKRALTCKQMEAELFRLLGNKKVAKLLVAKL